MAKKRSFLGQGWNFPPEFHEGINPTIMVSDEEDIRQSLRILLATRKGERIMNLDYGTNLHNLIFHNIAVR